MHPFVARRWHPIIEIGTAGRHIRLTLSKQPWIICYFSTVGPHPWAESNEAAAIAPVANDAQDCYPSADTPAKMMSRF